MKTIITAILLLVSTLAFSQGIGESYYDVMKSLKEDSDYSELKFDNTSNKDYNLITATTNWANYIYFFPKTGDWQRRCSVIAMISKSRQDASDFIEYLNSYCVNIDSKNWDFYRNDGLIVRVELKSVEGNLVFYYYPKS